ncbi:MAG: rhamnulokinase family protein [Verrucomicrobiota bacterium]|nr:rhamnulokinase family protein [Verrucomicrobiota bacterium]
MHYLACDLGAESGRLMLGTLEGDRLSLEELHRFPNGPVETEHGLCWEISRLFSELKAGLKIAANRKLPIKSISCDAWGLDYFLLDESGEVMEPTFCYRDIRNQRGIDRTLDKLSWESIYEETGIQFVQINSLFQMAAEATGRIEQMQTFLPLGDGFNYLLCGEAKAEISLASTTQLYNPRTGAWSHKILDAFNWNHEKFPELIPSGTRLGTLKFELAEESGLDQIEVIATCSHDTGSAVAAVPAEGSDWAYLSSGTWSLIGMELPEPIITDKSRELNFTNEIGYGNTVRLLRNCIGMWLLSECRRIWAEEGQEHDYATLTQIAEEAESFISLINPEDERFFKPDDMPRTIAGFCLETNQPEPATHGATVRCVLESLALLYAQRLKEAEELTGQPIKRLHIVGGGSRNALLNQFTANACGVEVIAGPTEATALGNVLVQAITLEDLPDLASARQVVAQSMDMESFQPEDSAVWDTAKTRFKELT